MNQFLVASIVLAAVSFAGAIEYAHLYGEEISHHPIASSYVQEEFEHGHKPYSFKYAVNDPHTGDYKTHHETREHGVVKGEYTIAEPDGTYRVVKYTADKHNGFQAKVYKVGKAIHPEVYGHHHHHEEIPAFEHLSGYEQY